MGLFTRSPVLLDRLDTVRKHCLKIVCNFLMISTSGPFLFILKKER
jgi:hypothetical protein